MLMLAAAMVTGCTTTIALDPAPAANDPRCANVSVRLPDTIEGLKRQWTDAQATASWGNKAAILRCGVEAPSQTTLQCVTIKGVDWTVDATNSPQLRLTTSGRTPAAEAIVDTRVLSADKVAAALASTLQQLPATTAGCGTPTPTPSPADGQKSQ